MALAVTSESNGPDFIARLFRCACPPVIGRIEKDRFLLDLRTIEDPSELLPHLP